MPNAVCLALALAFVLAAGPAPAEDYRVNAALGELLAHKQHLPSPTTPGGRNVLDNSCIYKDSFSLTASDVLLDRCDVAGATARFTAKYGRPDQTSQAKDGKTVLEYFLEFKENRFNVKFFIGCAADKTEGFALVECRREKNRVKPGPPPDDRPFWKKMLP